MKLKKKVNDLPKGTPIPGTILKLKKKHGANGNYEIRTIIDPSTNKRKFLYAETYDKAVLLLIEKNNALKSGKRLSTSKMNFGDLLDAYYNHRLENDVPHIIQKETLDINVYKLLATVREEYQFIKINNFVKNLNEVYKFIVENKYRGKMPTTTTIKDKVRQIHQVLNWGIDNKLFSYEEVEAIKTSRKNAKRITGRASEEIKAYTPREIKFILNQTKNHYGINALIQFQYYLGLRCEEALGLKWRDFDNINNILRIRGVVTTYGYKEITKTLESRRDLYIPEILRKLIKKIESDNLSDINKDSFILSKDMFYRHKKYITGSSRILNSSKIGSALRKIFVNTEMEGRVQSHNFRRTFATHSADNGVPIEKLMYILGHKDIKMTYDHYYKNSAYQIKQITVNTIDKFFNETYI